MSQQDFTVTRDELGVYHLEGQLCIYQLEKLKDFLDDLLKAHLEVNLSLEDVTLVDAAALQLLIAFRNASRARIKVHILSISAEIEKVLTISGLGAAFLGQAI